jgi:Domain of unknown function (DUF397)
MAARRDRYVTLAWRKSSSSADQGGCVEVAVWETFVLVRDSQNRSGGLLRMTSERWREFLDYVRGGSITPEEPGAGYPDGSAGPTAVEDETAP